MFDETLDELIDGLFSNPESDLILRWKGVFAAPFLPGTRVIYRQASGVIVDHTDPKLKPQPKGAFDRYPFPLVEVAVLFDGEEYKNGFYSPYWVLYIVNLKIEKEK